MNLAPKNDRMWFACWPSEYGLVPTDGTGYTHEASAWRALLAILRHTQPSGDWTKEKAQAAGWRAVRLWLSVGDAPMVHCSAESVQGLYSARHAGPRQHSRFGAQGTEPKQ